MIRFASTVALAGVLAIGFAGPLPAFAATADTTSPTTGATSHNPPSQEQHAQSGDHAKNGVTKQHTGSGDTGYGDRTPGVINNQNGMSSPGSTSTHR